MRILTIDTRSADDGTIANFAGILFILAAIAYGVLVFAEARRADSENGSIIGLSADDLPFIENNTYSLSVGACRSDSTDDLNMLVGRSRYDKESMSTQACGFDSRIVSTD